MLIYLCVLLVSLVVAVLVLKTISTIRSKIDKHQENSVIDLVMDFPKISAAVVFVVMLFGTYCVKGHLYGMYDCSVRSYSQGVETDYSWYYGKCRFKNEHGIWVDFDKLRGTPSGDEE